MRIEGSLARRLVGTRTEIKDQQSRAQQGKQERVSQEVGGVPETEHRVGARALWPRLASHSLNLSLSSWAPE